MKEWMEPVNSELPLAKAFNRIISDLELLRIMTNPRIFSDSTDKEAPFRMHNYYLTVLWERWLHGVYDNHAILNAILNDASSILHLHLDKTRFMQLSKSKSIKIPGMHYSN